MRLPLILATTVLIAACSQDAPTPAATETAAAPAAAQAGAPAAAAGVLDANTASEAELAAAPGMTPELAAALVAGRPYAGAAAYAAKLRETLSEEEAARMRETIFVPVNLNTATREDIAAIPGMTEKMIHEFEEYRPYEDMAEFDREIGKYVDAAEVARFRRYVTL